MIEKKQILSWNSQKKQKNVNILLNHSSRVQSDQNLLRFQFLKKFSISSFFGWLGHLAKIDWIFLQRSIWVDILWKNHCAKFQTNQTNILEVIPFFKFLGGRLVRLVGLVGRFPDAPKAQFVIITVQYWSMQKIFSLSQRVSKIWAFHDFFLLPFYLERTRPSITKN